MSTNKPITNKEIEEVFNNISKKYAKPHLESMVAGPGGFGGGYILIEPAPIDWKYGPELQLIRRPKFEFDLNDGSLINNGWVVEGNGWAKDGESFALPKEKETLPPILSADDKKELHENVKKNVGFEDKKEVAYMCPTCWEIYDVFEVMRKHHKDTHGAGVGATKELYQCTRGIFDTPPVNFPGIIPDYIPVLEPGETFAKKGEGQFTLSKGDRSVWFHTGIDMRFGVAKPLTEIIFESMRRHLNSMG